MLFRSIIGVGKKVSDALRKFDFKGTTEEWNRLVEHPDYEGSKELADHLMDNYKKKLTDKVVLIYFSYKNPMVHELRIVDYLPMEWEKTPHSPKSYLNFYIMEPDDHTLLRELLPKVLRSRIYAALLDSYSSEQGARTVAMQTASDNAGNLLDGLSIQLNRQRQQAITAEILDLSAAGEAENF